MSGRLKETCPDCGTRLELLSVNDSYLREGEMIEFHSDRKYCSECESFIGKNKDKELKPWKRYKPIDG